METELKDTLKKAIEVLMWIVAESEETEHLMNLLDLLVQTVNLLDKKNMRGLKVHITRQHLNKVTSNEK